MDDWNIRLRTHLARSVALQVKEGLTYFHPEGFGWDADFYSDIWAIGSPICKIHFGTQLFQFTINNPPLQATSQIIAVFGKIPPRFDLNQFNLEGFWTSIHPQFLRPRPPPIAIFPLDVVKVKGYWRLNE